MPTKDIRKMARLILSLEHLFSAWNVRFLGVASEEATSENALQFSHGSNALTLSDHRLTVEASHVTSVNS